MSRCFVKGCKSNTKKGGIHLHRFPSKLRNSERRKIWESYVNIKNVPEYAKLCELHFSDNQYILSRQDGRKPLRWNAIPDIPHVDEKASSSTECMEVEVEACNNDLETNLPNENETHTLKQKLKAAERKIRTLEEQLQALTKKYQEIFNKDQQQYLIKGSGRGYVWSDETINKGLKLYMACGTKGYEEIRKQKLPFPSIRTLQNRIETLKFRPGILHDIINIFKEKVSTMLEEEREACYVLDEIALKSKLEYDGTTGEVIGRITVPLSGSNENSKNVLATHGLVHMLTGVSSRWKQIVAYQLTGNSFNANSVYSDIIEIIKRTEEAGINIRCLVSDMGPQNQAIWKIMGISASRYSHINNFCEHPVDKKRKLYVMPDSVHVFKNIANSLKNGSTFILRPCLVKKYGLTSNTISIVPIQQVFLLDQDDELKLAPRLKESVMKPCHFDKMNVALSVALLNHDVAAALLYYISINKIAIEHTTTAWFLKMTYKWFTIMTARNTVLALSHFKENIYDDTIQFLKDFMDIITNMDVCSPVKKIISWKPFQSGVLLSTKTALDLQEEYLNKHHFKFLMLGRFTQDSLENVFSSVRTRSPVPDPKEFKTALRLITLAQFEGDVRRTGYAYDEAHSLIKYCKDWGKINHSENDNCSDILKDFTIYETVLEEDLEKEFLSQEQQNSLYYLIGAVVYKVKKNFVTCDICYSHIVTGQEDQQVVNISHFVKFKEFKSNILVFPALELYRYLYVAELFFRKNRDYILNNNLLLEDLLKIFIEEHGSLNVPNCHKIIDKVLKLFFKCRLYIMLRCTSEKLSKSGYNSDSLMSSKSVAMRSLVKNIK